MDDLSADTADTATAVADVEAVTPAPADTATPDTAAPDEAVDSDDAAYDAWAAGKAGEATDPDAATEPADAATETDPEAQPADEGQPDPITLDDADKTLLKRFHTPEKVLAAMDAPERDAFLAGLRERAAYGDTLGRKVADLEKQLNGGATPPPANAAAPALPEEIWQPVVELLGPDAAEPMRQAVSAMAQQQIQPLLQQQTQLTQAILTIADRLMNEDETRAFDELDLPEGLDKNNADVRKAILEEAERQKGQFHLTKNNRRHAIQRAAINLYHKKIAESAAQRKAQENQRKARGTPTLTSRTPKTAPVLSDEDREDLALTGRLDKGLTGDALQRYVDSGGRG